MLMYKVETLTKAYGNEFRVRHIFAMKIRVEIFLSEDHNRSEMSDFAN